VALQGTLDTFALPDVLRLLAATKKSGRLRITGGRGTGSVWVSSGEVVGVEATHAPHANEPVDALFELLRFQDGAFTFDAEATHDTPGRSSDVEILLAQSEAMLEEWRSIEAVVPSMDAWVTLRATLANDEVTVNQSRWTTLVAVGGGATVRRIADDLCLAELPISRAVKELVETGLVEIAETPPAGVVPHTTTAPVAVPELTPVRSRPLLAGAEEPPPLSAPAPAGSGPRARRAKGATASAPAEEGMFVPMSLPGQGAAPSYDPPEAEDEGEVVSEADLAEVDDLAAAFPGLANRSTPSTVDVDDEELAKQLATLSPRAASAIRAAAEATTDEERDAALDEVDDDDQPLNRGLLLKFLSSVKS
jgi:Domain of unknown function (DUF4388)